MRSKKNLLLEELVKRFSESIPAYENIEAASLAPILTNIESIGVTAGEYDRLGLQDVCLLVQEIFADIIENTGTLTERQIELLKQWRILILNYLKDGKDSTVKALTDFFNYSELNSGIAESDLGILKEMLQKEGDIFKFLFLDIITAVQNELTVDVKILNEKLKEFSGYTNDNNFAGLDEACHLFQHCLQGVVQLNKDQNNLLLDCLTAFEKYLNDQNDTDAVLKIAAVLKDENWSAPISEQEYERLLNTFGIEAEQAAKANIPEKLVDVYTQFREAADNIKVDNVQSIIDMADTTEALGIVAGDMELSGFQDICLIVKENLTDIINDNPSSIHDILPHINKWPALVETYLADPQQPDAAQNLFDYLSDRAWPSPAQQADLDILKDMMKPVEKPVEQFDATMQTTPERMQSAIVKYPKHVKEVINEIIDDVIDTRDILAAPHTVSKDLIGMLRNEILTVRQEVKHYIELFNNENTDQEIITDSLSQYALRFERFGSACQAAELDGLHQASSLFSENLNQLAARQIKLSEHQLSILSSWPQTILSYLENPGDNTSSHQLVEILQDEALPNSLMRGVAPALINLLKAVFVSDKDLNKESRQTIAAPEDVSITLPADINQELLDGMLLELPGQTEAFSAAIQSLIDGSGGISEVQKAQRIAHTLKGAANIVGVKGIAVLTHQLEDIMSALSDLNHLPPPALAAAFMDAADCLEEMSEALVEKSPSPANSVGVLQRVLDWANRIDAEGADCLGSEADAPKPADSAEAAQADDKPADASTAETILRVPAGLIDEILRLLGETLIVTSQLQERINQSTAQSQRLVEHQNMVQNLTADLEVQVDVKSTIYDQKQAANQGEVFDALELEEYNELHSVTHRIVEACVDSYELNQEIARDLRELDGLLADKLRLHHEVQELIMRTRMVPIKTISPRLQRIVRQTCRTTGKQAILKISGADTLIDSDVLNKLIDPLMHILRNAVDHGIELRVQRVQRKKDPVGNIRLNFSREGTQILVSCKDDGAGLDPDKILNSAKKRGLVEDTRALTPDDINRLILLPGFSTRDKATQTSGRGVGMDIVHTEILSMKGSVHIKSEKNNGCLVELRMPVTLISSHVLLLRHLHQIIAVSNHGIEKILHPDNSQIIDQGDKTLCEVDGEAIEMLTLESLLHLPEDRRVDERETRPTLLVRDEELNRVIYVREIIDTRDLFIKSMGKYLNNIKGIIGATILGDGSVVPVIDLPELIRAPVVHTYSPGELTRTDTQLALPVALVVDDSLSARRALAQVIHDAGFDVRTAKDGLEAVSIIENKIPDIMLVDMEMPRMNGMELTSHVRGTATTRDIPVMMITSRSTEKHRKQAEEAGVDVYITKPFSEDDLLDQIRSLLD